MGASNGGGQWHAFLRAGWRQNTCFRQLCDDALACGGSGCDWGSSGSGLSESWICHQQKIAEKSKILTDPQHVDQDMNPWHIQFVPNDEKENTRFHKFLNKELRLRIADKVKLNAMLDYPLETKNV